MQQFVSDDFWELQEWRDGAMAAKLDALRAIRPKCPTCKGKGTVRLASLMCDGTPCHDCVDGRVPIDEWIAKLVDTIREIRPYVTDQPVAERTDEVLAMVPNKEKR